jgi:L-2-hydroxyglutarate oxidase LhgO
VERVECIVVGAGVIGLAVARSLARRGREVIVLEAEEVIGSGVSSRNSCVIHAGLYYAAGSIKARVCVAGKHALYDFCEAFGVGHARVGKLLVATEEDQLPALHALRGKAHDNGVDDLVYLTPEEARELEPEVRCVGAMLSPSTGIIDVHEYMLALQGDAEAHGAMLALASPCVGGSIEDDGIHLEVGGHEPLTLICAALVNSAALGAQGLARSLRGLAPETIPPLHYAKGNYFSLSGRSPFQRLIYPMPSDAWLGIHSSLDLGGRCRFGPDLQWIEGLEYDVDLARARDFYASIRRYWPGLRDGALNPDYTGIRPKITVALDFVIQGEAEHAVPGLVNLYGIESPGLTSSLAIGEEVADLLDAGGA